MEAPQVQIDTSMGSFTVELYYKHAPKTVKNFVKLAEKGYYDGTIVSSQLQHRGSELQAAAACSAGSQ
jgi:cyclophilin family peptidyl-prolyl cis-trans isomerase